MSPFACLAGRIFRHNSAKADAPMNPDDRDEETAPPPEPAGNASPTVDAERPERDLVLRHVRIEQVGR